MSSSRRKSHVNGAARSGLAWILALHWFLSPHSISVTSSECIIDVTEASGNITSPNYPNLYTNNYNCSWLIHAAPGSTIHLTFLEFELESAADCYFDYVQILEKNAFGANLTPRLCGGSGGNVSLTSTDSLWINFKTDSSVAFSGFLAQFRQSAPGISATDYVQLYGGNDSYEGQLRVYYGGSWSNVCRNTWTEQNSLVVCRSLFGESFRGTLIPWTASVPAASGLLGAIQCSGDESNVLQCRRLSVVSPACTHTDYVALRCVDDAVRLVEGLASTQGVVERRVSGTWVPICGDGFDLNAVSVVCRQLGFSANNATFEVSAVNRRLSASWRYLCTGQEDSLAQCQGEYGPCSSNSTVRIACKELECGVVRGQGPYSHIIGGQPATAGQYPWMVMLVLDNAFQCGGTIIDPWHVVTAAHCFDCVQKIPANLTTPSGVRTIVQYINTTGLQVIAGKHEFPFNVQYASEQKVNVSAAAQHQLYTLESGESSNDIAVLRLERPLMFNTRVSALCLPKATSTVPSLCTVAGWGRIEGLAYPEQLMSATMTAYSRTACLRLESQMVPQDKDLYRVDLATVLPQKSMCMSNATHGGEQTCFGDSGGPSFCLDPRGTHYELLGVVSFGYGRCPALKAFPAVFTYVPPYLSWIRQTLEHLASPCATLHCSRFSTCHVEGDRGRCVCPSGFSGQLCDQCGQTMTAPQGNLASANYPAPYFNNMNCVWTIVVPPGSSVVFTFLDFFLQSCLYDYVEVQRNNTLQYPVRLCGSSLPTPIVSNTSLVIRFVTDSFETFRGFKASYTIIEGCPDYTYGVNCSQSCRCVRENSASCDRFSGMCDCKVGWEGVTCADDVNECQFTCSGNNEVCLNSPGGFNCNCTEGYVRNVTGDCVPVQCQRLQCSPFSTCRKLGTDYVCDCSPGFSGQRCDQCGEILTALQGNFTSVNYPLPYLNNMNCQWTIVVPLGFALTINFLDLETESCGFDYVQIRKNNAFGPLLATLCGLSYRPVPILSNTTLHVRFVTDRSVVHRGFQASYTITGCPEFKYGDNCSLNCGCIRDNTVSCDAGNGSCTCKAGWEGAYCQNAVNQCELVCTGVREVCRQTPDGFECLCVEGSARNLDGVCAGCPEFKYGDNCSLNCHCARDNTVSCDADNGSCNCKAGWDGATCQNRVNPCESVCTGVREVCSQTPDGFECLCVEGSARNSDGACVETLAIPVTVNIGVNIVFNSHNKLGMDALSSQVKSELLYSLQRKASGVLDVKLNSIRRGSRSSIIADAEVLVEKRNAAGAVSTLTGALKKMIRLPVYIYQQSGYCSVEAAGINVSPMTQPCDLINALNVCNRPTEKCYETSGNALCRNADKLALEVWQIVLIAACSAAVFVAVVVVVIVCCLRKRKLKKQSAENDRPESPRGSVVQQRPCLTGHGLTSPLDQRNYVTPVPTTPPALTAGSNWQPTAHQSIYPGLA